MDKQPSKKESERSDITITTSRNESNYSLQEHQNGTLEETENPVKKNRKKPKKNRKNVHNKDVEGAVQAEKDSNNSGSGWQYEINVPAYFALKLNKNPNVKNFSIRSNAPEFGNLDDVIIDVTLEKGEPQNFAIQLKHRESRDSISPVVFHNSKSPFSLDKYCAAFKTIPDDKRENYHYILYTSQNFKNNLISNVKKFTMVEAKKQDFENLFFEANPDVKNTYRFEVNDETPESTQVNIKKNNIKITKSDYETFFSKLTIFSGQKHFEDFEQLIRDILKEENAVGLYLNFFRKWHQGFFDTKTIDRKTLNIHLVDIYLPSCLMLTDYRSNAKKYTKVDLFEKIIKAFDVIVVDESKKNFNMNLIKIVNFDNIELHQLAIDYKLIDKNTTTIEQEDKANKIYCLCVQNLLIIDFDKRFEETVYNLINVYTVREDKIKFILLGHEVDLSRLSSVQVFDNLETLSKTNRELYEEITKHCMISIQGRQAVSLQKLVESSDDMKSVFETKEIVEMLEPDYFVGEKVELPQRYTSIPRRVSTIVFTLRSILDTVKNNRNLVIVEFDPEVSVITQEEIKRETIHLVELYQYFESKNVPAKRPVILSKDEVYVEKYGETIITKETGKFMMVFKKIAGDTFILIRSPSKFSTENLDTKTFLESDIHSKFDGGLNLLVGESGVGKSTFMNYLRYKCACDCWTLYADLNTYFFRLKHTSEEFLEHLLKAEMEESTFLRKLITAFKQEKKIVFFLDGLDRLQADCIDNVLEIIESLLQTGYRIWVSSQPQAEERFLEKFNVMSLRLEEFSYPEQKEYINCFLESEPKCVQTEVKRFTDQIFEGIRIADNENFFGIPLNLNILTNMFLDEGKRNQNFFAVTKVYKHFFEEIYQHYFGKRDYAPSQFLLKDLYLQLYEVLALEEILDGTSFQKLGLRSEQNFRNNIEENGDDLGIVVKVDQGKITFAHKAYAAYFACVWLRSNPKKINRLKKELFSPKYEHLFLMLNITMAENNPLHLSILYKSIEQFETYIDEQEDKDEGGRFAVHIACCSGMKYLDLDPNSDTTIENDPVVTLKEEPQWYTKMIETLFRRKIGISVQDTLFKFGCLDYACASKSLHAIKVGLKENLTNFDAEEKVKLQTWLPKITHNF